MNLGIVGQVLHQWQKIFLPQTFLWLLEAAAVAGLWWGLDWPALLKVAISLVIMGLGASYNSFFVNSVRRWRQEHSIKKIAAAKEKSLKYKKSTHRF